MTDPIHVRAECPSQAEREKIMSELVELLIENRTLCPCCLNEIVLEFAAESRELWQMINQQMH